MNNENFTKREPQGAPLLFLYEVSVEVLINFIAILQTPGIFLIQIFNTNNTNMYLIQFHSKNIIKICFPQSWVLKVSKPLQTFIIHHNVSEINALTSAKTTQHRTETRFKKKKLMNNYYIIYIVQNFDRFFYHFFNLFF